MKNVIELSRERKTAILIKIRNGQEDYILQNDDKLIFGIKKNKEDENYTLVKIATAENNMPDNSGCCIELTPEDTNIIPGRYWYDVALERTSGILEKVIGCTPLIVYHSIVRGGYNG